MDNLDEANRSLQELFNTRLESKTHQSLHKLLEAPPSYPPIGLGEIVDPRGSQMPSRGSWGDIAGAGLTDITKDLEKIDPKDILLMSRNCKLSPETHRKLAAILTRKIEREKAKKKPKHWKQILKRKRAGYREYTAKTREQRRTYMRWRHHFTVEGIYFKLKHREIRGSRVIGFTLDEFKEVMDLVLKQYNDVELVDLVFYRPDRYKALSKDNIRIEIKEKKEILYIRDIKE